jgi:hypothetical protein
VSASRSSFQAADVLTFDPGVESDGSAEFDRSTSAEAEVEVKSDGQGQRSPWLTASDRGAGHEWGTLMMGPLPATLVPACSRR